MKDEILLSMRDFSNDANYFIFDQDMVIFHRNKEGKNCTKSRIHAHINPRDYIVAIVREMNELPKCSILHVGDFVDVPQNTLVEIYLTEFATIDKVYLEFNRDERQSKRKANLIAKDVYYNLISKGKIHINPDIIKQ